MTAYYNEIDPAAAAWLRELIKDGLIAPGDVDERSIVDVRANELVGYSQHHFFAGIGGWSLSLRLAGWPDDRPVVTGSCPCQPFSAAGKGKGFDDERHLWPAFQTIISELRPAVVFGEQVASKAVDPWIDLVQLDLEAMGYAFGSVPFSSAGVGAPHIRDRNYWVGYAVGAGLERFGSGHSGSPGQREGEIRPASEAGESGGVANTEHPGHGGQAADQTQQGRNEQKIGLFDRGHSVSEGQPATSPTNGYWRDADWLYCRDGKWRPAQPGTSPLVVGLPRGVVPSSRQGMAFDANKTAEARTMRLKGYGNAINPHQAAMFIECFMEYLK